MKTIFYNRRKMAGPIFIILLIFGLSSYSGSYAINKNNTNIDEPQTLMFISITELIDIYIEESPISVSYIDDWMLDDSYFKDFPEDTYIEKWMLDDSYFEDFPEDTYIENWMLDDSYFEFRD
ncbi:hypothetical protein ACFLTI_00920 [Bacteroidota bacterium]